MLGALFYMLGAALVGGIFYLFEKSVKSGVNKVAWIEKAFPNLTTLLCQTFNLQITSDNYVFIDIGPKDETHFTLTRSNNDLIIDYFYYPEGSFDLQSIRWMFNQTQSEQEILNVITSNVAFLQSSRSVISS